MATLNDISAADFLKLVETGEVNLNDYLTPSNEQEKVASTLSEMSDDDLLDLLMELEGGSLEKEAGAFDLNELSVGEFIEFAAHLEEEMGMEKEAGEFDLNQLSVDEFLAFAADLEEEMNKEAGAEKGVLDSILHAIPGYLQFGRANKKMAQLLETPEAVEAFKKGGDDLENYLKNKITVGKEGVGNGAREISIGDRLSELRDRKLIGGAKMGATGLGTLAAGYGVKQALS